MVAKTNIYRSITVVFILLGLARICSAGLFASLDFEQGVTYTTVIPDSTGLTQVIDSTTPFSKTVTLNTENGGTITSTYGVYDTGTAAGLEINTSAATTAINNTLAEQTLSIGAGGGRNTMFEFSEPLTYSIEVVTNGQISGGEVEMGSYYPGGGIVNLGSMKSNMVYSFDGMLQGGVPYYLTEFWQLSNQIQGNGVTPPAVVSGSESVTFTFTAVPEPSSAAVIAVSALAARRRHRRRAP
jgi:hypothetical protein